MNATTSHQDHLRADEDHAAWLAEIADWRQDHQRALDTLSRTAEFIRQHDAGLEHHESVIRDHHTALEMHETALEDKSETAEVLGEHQRLEGVHRTLREERNRLRGRHRGLIDEIRRLEVELHRVSHSRAERSAHGL